MNCELAQQEIALFAYGELPDDQCHELEGHLTTCSRCQEELAAVQALQQAMALAPTMEPSANLLAQARMRLEEALDTMPRSGWVVRIEQSMVRGVSMLSRAPLAASALLVFGLACGGAGGYESALHARRAPVVEPSSTATISGPGEIGTISSVVLEPGSENVDIRFNRLVPETAHGSLHDSQIQHLLLLAAQSQVGSGVENKSLDLLLLECEAGHQCPAGPVREALMVALRYDRDPRVSAQSPGWPQALCGGRYAGTRCGVGVV